MKTSKFSESQIVAILKQQDAGVKVAIPAASMGSARRRSTSGGASMAGWSRSRPILTTFSDS